MRSVGRYVSVLGIVIALTVLAGSSALGAWPKTFTGLKTCATFAVDHTCLITESTVKILTGAVVTYTDPIIFYPVGAPDRIDSDVTLRAAGQRGSTANGHCVFYLVGHGHCDYWSGTGRLTGFHASVEVGASAAGFPLSGTYWFEHGSED
jgi:hypothetical protein